MVKETVSRSVVAKRMGSNPIPRKQFLCSLKTEWREERRRLQIALAQSVERRPFKPNVAGSSPACGKELVVSSKLLF